MSACEHDMSKILFDGTQTLKYLKTKQTENSPKKQEHCVSYGIKSKDVLFRYVTC